MPEHETEMMPEVPQTTKPSIDGLDNTVPVVYANDCSIIVGNEDVSILFGYNVVGGDNLPTIPSVRLVLTHGSFVRMMEYWSKRVTLLRTVYQENPIGFLETGTELEIINKAFEDMNKE